MVQTDGVPQIGVNPIRNEFLVVWEGRPLETQEYNIYGQRVGADGSRIEWSFRISRGAGDSGVLEPAVAYSPETERYLVVWEDLRSQQEQGRHIFGQLVAGKGSRLGRNFRVSGANAAEARFPSVASDLDGDYLVTWTDERRLSVPTHYNDIFAHTITKDGDRTGPDLRVTRHRAIVPIEPGALAYGSANNEYLVLWNDDRQPTGTDIFARRVAS